MDWRDHIGSDPAICHGKPCVRGTRIPVSVVLANLADGMSTEALLREYPTLTATSIRAALLFASELVQQPATDRGAA